MEAATTSTCRTTIPRSCAGRSGSCRAGARWRHLRGRPLRPDSRDAAPRRDPRGERDAQSGHPPQLRLRRGRRGERRPRDRVRRHAARQHVPGDARQLQPARRAQRADRRGSGFPARLQGHASDRQRGRRSDRRAHPGRSAAEHRRASVARGDGGRCRQRLPGRQRGRATRCAGDRAHHPPGHRPGREGRRSFEEQLYFPAPDQVALVRRLEAHVLRFGEGGAAMMRTSTIHGFFATAARDPDRVAVKRRLGPGRWSAMTWDEYAREVRRVARALVALGVRPGERIALCGPNRPEWLLADLGALAAGAVPAPYYPTLTAEQATYVVEHSESVLAIVHDAKQLAKLDAMRSRPPRLRARVVMEGAAPGALSWSEFVARAGEVPDSAVDDRLERLESDALATLIYTSGTTGPPKAVMISHGNLLFAAEVAREQLQVGPEDELISYLPLSHIAEQMASLHGPSVNGYCVACCENLEELPEALREVRPTLFLGVPRVWEKIQARVEERQAQAPPLRRALFRWAQRTELARAPRWSSSSPWACRSTSCTARPSAPAPPPATRRSSARSSAWAGRCRGPRCASRRTARSSSAARTSSSAISRTARRRPRRSRRTAGCGPATWEAWIATGSSTSPTARRTCSSPPGARTCRPRTSRDSWRGSRAWRTPSSWAMRASTWPR